MRFAAALLAAYSTVLVAKLVGDKLLYTAASLAARFRASLVLAAMALAFSGKMGVAVMAGSALAKIPSLWTALLPPYRSARYSSPSGAIQARLRPLPSRRRLNRR